MLQGMDPLMLRSFQQSRMNNGPFPPFGQRFGQMGRFGMGGMGQYRPMMPTGGVYQPKPPMGLPMGTLQIPSGGVYQPKPPMGATGGVYQPKNGFVAQAPAIDWQERLNRGGMIPPGLLTQYGMG